MKPAVLYEYACTRFQEAFGEPHNTLGLASQWSLNVTAGAAPVYVLITSAGSHPSVWVFDPHAIGGQSPVTVITTPEQVDALIARIKSLGTRTTFIQEPSAIPELREYPVRIDGFVRSVRGWSEQVSQRKVERARAESEKVRMFGLFLTEDKQFHEAYQRNQTDDCRQIDDWQALNSMCSFLNAVADVVRAGPNPGPLWSPR